MKKQMIRQSVIAALVFSLVVGVITVGVFYRIKTQENQNDRYIYIQNELAYLSSLESLILNRLYMSLSDLNYITNNVESFYDGSTQSTESIQLLWQEFSGSKAIYDQIRLFDMDGMELIRVDYDDGQAVAYSDQQLQDKSNRYYFIETAALEAYQTYYMSLLDLNVEDGFIEKPYKPMLRIGRKVYDGNQPIGVTMLNYSAGNMLDAVKISFLSSHSNELYLLNNAGYYFADTSGNHITWGFMFDYLMDETMSVENPALWSQLSAGEEGSFRDDSGTYVYRCIDVSDTQMFNMHNISPQSVVSAGGCWYAVTFIPDDNVFFTTWTSGWDMFEFYVGEGHLIVWIFILAMCMVFLGSGWYFYSKMQIEFISKYDRMSGAYNRQFGLKTAESMIELDKRIKSDTGVIFCDLNGLKYVNDHYGHETGDRLIKEFSAAVRKHIRWQQRLFLDESFHSYLYRVFPNMKGARESDVFIRIGGDEFLIICKNADTTLLDKIWLRIDAELAMKRVKSVPVSASHGSTLIHAASRMTLYEAINDADQKMYVEKALFYEEQKE